jgi:CRP-like cAMP-binding protein
MTLSTIERVLFLRGVELFVDVPGEVLLPVARLAQEVYFDAGDRFIRQGDVGDCLYIIVNGEASVMIQNVGEVARRGPRSIIGEMAIISRQPRSAHCDAQTDITALRVDHDDFWALLDEQPMLARGVINVLARRLDEAISNLRSFALPR